MSTVTISQLPAATALSGSEQVPGLQAGSSVAITVSQLAAFVTAGAGGATTQVQYNNGGALAGNAGLTFVVGTGLLSATQISTGPLTAGAVTAGAVSASNVNVTSATVPANGWYLSAANTLAAATNGAQRATIGNTGDVTITQQAAATGANAILFGGPSGVTINRLRYNSNSTANNQFALRDDASAVDRVTVSAVGAVAITAPSSAAISLTVNQTAGGATQALLSTGWAQVNGDLGANSGLSIFNTSATDGRAAISFRSDLTTSHTWSIGMDVGGTSAKTFAIRDITAGTIPLTIATTSGIFTNGATGGDKGSGTLNATGLYVNGVAVATGGTPGGSPTQLQYNNAGAFGGTTMTYALASGTFVIPAPTSGTALTINGQAATASALRVVLADSASTGILMIDGGANTSHLRLYTDNTSAYVEGSGAAATPLRFMVGTIGATINAMTIGSAGAVAINSPSAGIPLTVSQGNVSTTVALFTNSNAGANSSPHVQIASTAANGSVFMSLTSNSGTPGTNDLSIWQNGVTREAHVTNRANAALYLGANNTDAVTIAGTGGMQLGAPTGGDKGAGTINVASGLYVNGVAVTASSGPQYAYKTATTQRASTTVNANDPDLAVTIAATGWYWCRMVIACWDNGGAGGGINIGMNYSTTFANAGPINYYGRANSAAVNGSSTFGSAPVSGGLSIALLTNGSGFDVIIAEALIQVTAAGGTLGVQWAQASSNVVGTVLGTGSFLMVTKIA